MKTQAKDPIAREGIPFILAALALTILGFWIHPASGILFFVLFVFVVYFFRNPARRTPLKETAVISPADGRILFIDEVEEGRFLKSRVRKISIFMSPLNVHVNRIPASGTVREVAYNKGKFISAFKEKASLDNEQNAIVLETITGKAILFVQIAGFIARRIVCYAQPKETWNQGTIFGLIRFGSRMDVYVPLEYKVSVKKGERVKAGETIIAEVL